MTGDVTAEVLAAARGARVLLVGDLMLDEHVTGVVERVSPEAPVPVLRATGGTRTPGGAANVARQLAAFGAAIDLVGVVGDDGLGRDLRERCRTAGIGVDGVAVVEGLTTTHKQRIVAGRQQMLRIDREDAPPPQGWPGVDLAAAVAGRPRPDAVVVSDYAKGVVDEALVAAVVAQARRWGVPVLVDPRPGPWTRYRGATLVKANRVEVEGALGRRLGLRPEADLVAPVRALMGEADVARAVVTLGERGMVAIDDDGSAAVIDQEVREVFDVSGAGDTVLAVLALGLVAGVPLVEAARMANRTAGLVVSRAGVTIAWPSDLASAPARDGAPGTVGEVAARAAAWRAEGRRVVFTNGCFDLLHPGHLHLLRRAAAEGDVVVVAVNSDRSVARLKGPSRPVLGEAERLAMVAAVDVVDAVVVLDDDDPAALVEAIRPDVLVKGADYRREDVVGGDAVESWGGRVVLVPLVEGWSTTAVAEGLDGGQA